ncbi:short-chain dehydrogenase [candidate division WOR-1 bacterium RIFOXYB2_FULL_48_7]|uniref:Short-chain dehydrogenase n=1 Tax=candidate division WOR-1 bacterium RIFOXYB2_FULL_48_7 TaxID=1802583 RepID=A0A1F4TJX3_UNCSA|nr:MAG: short-chain dehydrogenase [candidate division WOR-1 bacterium RIFOXYB2_FULL_48_7]
MIALVTGASKGIGRAIADLLEKQGYELLTPSHQELDLASSQSVDTYLAKLSQPIDVLINNAGINPLGELANLTDRNIEETMMVNLVSPLRLIRGVVKGMKASKYGRIVNISSIWSVAAKSGRSVYSISKAGINALTRSLAVELAADNILINAVAPGFTDTELTRKNLSAAEIEQVKGQIPLRRLAQPQEIAELVAFLCSQNNTYITGQTILIDGGFTCQ